MPPTLRTSPSQCWVIDPRILRRFHAQPRGLRAQVIRQKRVGLIHINRCARERPQLFRAANMIDMRVRDDDHLHGEPMTLQYRGNFFDVVAGIDHDGFERRGVAQDRTIAAEQAHRQNFVNQCGFRLHTASIIAHHRG